MKCSCLLLYYITFNLNYTIILQPHSIHKKKKKNQETEVNSHTILKLNKIKGQCFTTVQHTISKRLVLSIAINTKQSKRERVRDGESEKSVPLMMVTGLDWSQRKGQADKVICFRYMYPSSHMRVDPIRVGFTLM